ncbi:MAG TPA: MCP four helix bundle domain-containing protein [Candidatus Limnocylindria bacterium]|nr:MCP four helix bundle domain-containing protein [Candidatus Limnocylindria bacterium]
MKTNRVMPKLAAAFGVLIVLLVTVGCWGVDHLAKMNRKVQVIVNQRWQMVKLSREALRYSSLNSGITMQIFLLLDKKEIEPLLGQRAKNTAEISELLKTIEARLEIRSREDLVGQYLDQPHSLRQQLPACVEPAPKGGSAGSGPPDDVGRGVYQTRRLSQSVGDVRGISEWADGPGREGSRSALCLGTPRIAHALGSGNLAGGSHRAIRDSQSDPRDHRAHASRRDFAGK